MSKKTILFVMARLPFPAISGRKNSLYNYCKILSELNYRLVVAAFLESGDSLESIPDFIEKLVVLPNPGSKEKVINILRDSFMKFRKPIQVGLFYSKKAQIIINEIIEKECPDVIISDMIRTTEFTKNVNIYKIADFDDLISRRYERQVINAYGHVNPYGAYVNQVPKYLQKILLSNCVKKFILNREIRLLKQYELEMGSIYNKAIFVAEKEAEYFNACLKEDKAVFVPIGVDIEYFGANIEPIFNGEWVGFLGAMNVAHNEHTVQHFIVDIFPRILEQIPTAKVLIVGGGVGKTLKSYECENIVFVGRVEDVRPYIKSMRVFVCPMVFGSGIKTKLLEAMAMGIPIVTTTVGAENIDAQNGCEWVIEDSVEGFADAVIELLLNCNKRETMKIAARTYVSSKWTWKSTMTEFNKILGEVE